MWPLSFAVPVVLTLLIVDYLNSLISAKSNLDLILLSLLIYDVSLFVEILFLHSEYCIESDTIPTHYWTLRKCTFYICNAKCGITYNLFLSIHKSWILVFFFDIKLGFQNIEMPNDICNVV